MFWSNDGTGPKSGCDCRMEFSRSSVSKSCALHIASLGATAQLGAGGAPQFSTRAASDCQAQENLPLISWTMGCWDSVELRNSSLSQLRQKGLRKSASRGTPLLSSKMLSALKSPWRRPCNVWKRRLSRIACCPTKARSCPTCSQVPPPRCVWQEAVLCKRPVGCVRSNIRRMSPTVRQPSKYSNTNTSHGIRPAVCICSRH
mmetsp:Transcript_88090/g.174816  ORF Transcript_88090/g.174816 Transcript_88090/m.174816 type:complete len:202 (-) Transcript_88090:634-1239(-)